MQRNYGIGSPMKAEGEKGNFLQRLGKEIFGKDARQKRVDKQAKRREGTEYEFNPDGTRMTSMEAARAEKKSRKPGESKFQADSRKMGEKKRADNKKRKAENKADAEFYGSTKDNAKPRETKATSKPGEFSTKQTLEKKLVVNNKINTAKVSDKAKNQAKINAKNKGGGYSNATSVNALVVQRDRFRADPKNKGKKYPGQAEINKRLKKDPKKFD